MKGKNIVGIAKVKHPQNKSEIEITLFNLVDEMKEKNKKEGCNYGKY